MTEEQRYTQVADDAPYVWDALSFEWPRAIRTVVEVGGFTGRWALGMARRYPNADLHIFEPARWALTRTLDTMVDEGLSATLHPYALGLENGIFPMRGWGTDSNSFLKGDAFFAANPDEHRDEQGFGRMRAIEEVVVFDRPIDVLMMNIEGYEFRLLPRMVALGCMPLIENICVQFHAALDRGGEEEAVRAMLGETHEVVWDYPALTAWRRG